MIGWLQRLFSPSSVPLPSPPPPASIPVVAVGAKPVHPDAIALIKASEGYGDAAGVRAGRVPSVNHAYLCPAKVWTIGYGTTRWPNGTAVKEGQTITPTLAGAIAAMQISEFAKMVDAVVKVPITPRERGALVSLAYNIGMGAFRKSTLLRLLNSGHKEAAAAQFGVWVRGNGKVLPGLVTRRAAEMALFRAG